MLRMNMACWAAAATLGAAATFASTAQSAPLPVATTVAADRPAVVEQVGYYGRGYGRGGYYGGYGAPLVAGAALGLIGAATFGGYGPYGVSYYGRPYGYGYGYRGYARPYGYGYRGHYPGRGYGFRHHGPRNGAYYGRPRYYGY